jgi:hypothetical protein
MKTTIKHQRHQQQEQLMSRLSRLLGLSHEQLHHLMFETGCQYMEALTDLSEVAQQFLTEPIYWNWWRQQWAIVDAQFLIEHAQAPLQMATMRALYEKMHRSIDTWPDKVIWTQVHDAYELMVCKVIENHIHNNP